MNKILIASFIAVLSGLSAYEATPGSLQSSSPATDVSKRSYVPKGSNKYADSDTFSMAPTLNSDAASMAPLLGGGGAAKPSRSERFHASTVGKWDARQARKKWESDVKTWNKYKDMGPEFDKTTRGWVAWASRNAYPVTAKHYSQVKDFLREVEAMRAEAKQRHSSYEEMAFNIAYFTMKHQKAEWERLNLNKRIPVVQRQAWVTEPKEPPQGRSDS